MPIKLFKWTWPSESGARRPPQNTSKFKSVNNTTVNYNQLHLQVTAAVSLLAGVVMLKSPLGIRSFGEQHQHAETVPETEASQDEGSELAEEPHRLLPAGSCHPWPEVFPQNFWTKERTASFFFVGFFLAVGNKLYWRITATYWTGVTYCRPTQMCSWSIFHLDRCAK